MDVSPAHPELRVVRQLQQRPSRSGLPGDLVHHHETGIVAGIRIFPTDVPETYNQHVF